MERGLEQARQWIRKADNDLLDADNNLRSERIPFDTVCFHCRQATEKCLKAVLVFRQQPHPLTHDLLWLLEQVLGMLPRAEELREDLILLMPYAVEARYPGDTALLTCEDAGEARTAAGRVHDWVRYACPDLFR
jgi:HEPN domain-containing protein